MDTELKSFTVKIEQVGISQLDTAQMILEGTTSYLQSLGHLHWNGHYTVERIARYLKERNFYILIYQGEPVGTIVTTLEKNSSGWTDNEPALYLSTLAVLKEYQNKGFGSLLLSAVEEEAKSKGLNKIRFDSVQNYEELNQFYIRRGYSVVGKWGKPYRKFDYFLYERDIQSKLETKQ